MTQPLPGRVCIPLLAFPASAVGQENALRKIYRGAHADLLAVPLSGGDVLEEIIAFTGEPWMMLAGQVQ